MKHNVGICPACTEVALAKPKQLFFVCPHCGKTVSTHQARTYLESFCADPSGINNVLSLCLDLEKEHGAEVPLQILAKLHEKHPHNESVAFTYVRMSGYRQDIARHYLKSFAAVKRTVPFATEFLDNMIVSINVSYAGLLLQFIENKLPIEQQKRYKDRVAALKSEFEGNPNETGEGMTLLYIFYVLGTCINAGLALLFIFLNLHIAFYIMIAVVACVAEMFLLFLHNRNYGNRIGIEPREKLLMSIFMSSIVVIIAGVVIGALVSV